MKNRKSVYETRDELANWMVSTWRDAIAFKYDHPTVLKQFDRVYSDKRYKRLPLYAKQYIHGYERSFHTHVVDRQFLEHGAWVRMPDGTEKWYGTHERAHDMSDVITHRYIFENAIEERSGIYWVADPKRNTASGEKPHFIPALHFQKIVATTQAA